MKQVNDSFLQDVYPDILKKNQIGSKILSLGRLNNDYIIALSEDGLYKWDAKKWSRIEKNTFRINEATIAEGSVYRLNHGQIEEFSGSGWITYNIGEPVIKIVKSENNKKLFFQTEEALGIHENNNFTIIPVPEKMLINCAAIHHGKIVIGAKEGLFEASRETLKWERVYVHDGNKKWIPEEIKAVAYTLSGNLIFAEAQGLGIYTGDKWKLYTGDEGLPFNDFTSLSVSENEIWLGTSKGVIRLKDDKFSFRFSRRWLPDDYIYSIFQEKDGYIWFGTANGVGVIESKEFTLKEKAEYFDQQVELRHNRDGYVTDCKLNTQYDIDSWATKITDNDGMYTGMYGAAQALRYSVTKDPEAKVRATRSLMACKKLIDVTGLGFPARVVVPSDWHEPLNEQYDHAYNQDRQTRDPFWKMITPRFPLSKDGKYMWKCDTSSDELIGHYFFYPLYFDLVAETEEEKELVKNIIATLTDHLVDNGYLLRDHDGKPTRWGDFSPQFVNSLDGWGERGLNSVMILSFLRAAKHVTGDKKYDEHAQILMDKHNYHINALSPKTYFPPEHVVPWDSNLSLMSLYILIRYERDPELMPLWRTSMEYAWLHISKQKNAFWNFLYQGAREIYSDFFKNYSTEDFEISLKMFKEDIDKNYGETDPNFADSLETLQLIPLDLIGYSMDNTFRLDIQFDPTPGEITGVGTLHAKGWLNSTKALPIDERGHVRQDRDAFMLYINESNGFAEQEGTFYTLPYYFGLYHGFL